MSGKSYDPKVLDQVQKIEKSMFRDFIAVCEKHNIQYFVIAGTAIGTMRDHDMIPWDDDIDVAMLRRDYEKFLRVAPKELGEKYLVNGPDTPRAYYNLIPNLNVKENIEVGAYLSEHPLDIDELLQTLGLYEHRHKLPNQLSGGQQQRTSIGRALVKNPDILLCDEPTGALDSETGVMVLKLLLSMARDMGKTIIIVTHNQNIAKMADVVIRVKNGKIQACESQDHPLSVEEVDW